MRDRLNPANQREAVTFGRESVGLAALPANPFIVYERCWISSVLCSGKVVVLIIF